MGSFFGDCQDLLYDVGCVEGFFGFFGVCGGDVQFGGQCCDLSCCFFYVFLWKGFVLECCDDVVLCGMEVLFVLVWQCGVVWVGWVVDVEQVGFGGEGQCCIVVEFDGFVDCCYVECIGDDYVVVVLVVQYVEYVWVQGGWLFVLCWNDDVCCYYGVYVCFDGGVEGCEVYVFDVVDVEGDFGECMM